MMEEDGGDTGDTGVLQELEVSATLVPEIVIEDSSSDLPEPHEALVQEPPARTSGKKRKATEGSEPEAKSVKVETDNQESEKHSENDDDDDGAFCPICFEPWTNSGEHRISSLKCGHFFGKGCIEKWLKSSGDDCPNCNEKATKKDVRLHYVARLKAVDTADKDRAVKDLDRVKSEMRTLELEYNTLKVKS